MQWLTIVTDVHTYSAELLLLLVLLALGGESHLEAPPTPVVPGSASSSPAPPRTSSPSMLIGPRKVGVGTVGVAMAPWVVAVACPCVTLARSMLIGWSFVSLLELCQLEVESWLGRRSFSLKELSRNGSRVSSSLESKSDSPRLRGGAERLGVEPPPPLRDFRLPSVAPCCFSLSATFGVGFLLRDGFCVEGALPVYKRMQWYGKDKTHNQCAIVSFPDPPSLSLATPIRMRIWEWD